MPKLIDASGPQVTTAASSRVPGRRRGLRRSLASAITSFVILAALAAPAKVLGAGIYTYDAKGFDTCTAPIASNMQTWWTYSPYYWMNIYIGGIARGCTQPNLTASWVTTVRGQGWGLLPTWVGPQAPCSGYTHRFSSDLTTATQQGMAEADAAWAAASNLGLGSAQVIAYDLEPFSTSCIGPVQSFIGGWVWELHKHSGEKAGVYGSSCASNLDLAAWYATNRADWIWGKWADGSLSVHDMNCIASNHFTGYTRHKQYSTSVSESWHGISILIDRDCAYGPMYSNASRVVSQCF
jgi:hypothetical protein